MPPAPDGRSSSIRDRARCCRRCRRPRNRGTGRPRPRRRLPPTRFRQSAPGQCGRADRAGPGDVGGRLRSADGVVERPRHRHRRGAARPPRDPAALAAVANLWRRLLQSDRAAAGRGAQKFQALRAEAYQRSGLLHERSEALARALGAGGAAGSDAVLVAMKARGDIALGQPTPAARRRRMRGPRKADLPSDSRARSSCWSATARRSPAMPRPPASRPSSRARRATTQRPALAALDAIATGADVARAEVALPKRIDAIDYRLLQLTAAPARHAAASAPIRRC